jgi:putative ABC transport system permease protein
MKDLRYALRRIARSPGFSAVVVITLALGIGANTALFTVIDAVLLQPLPYAHPDRLVTIQHHYPSLNDLKAPVSVPGFRDYSGRTELFESAAVENGWSPNLTESGEPQRLRGARVSGRFFGTLGVPTVAGRPLVSGDDQAGRDHVAVLSDGLASRLFGGTAAVGKHMRLDGQSYEVVGVMPPSFRDFFNRKTELWAPLVFKPEDFADANRTNESLGMTARLKPGVTIERAARELANFGDQLRHDHPDDYPTDWGLLLISLHEKASGDVKSMLFVLFGAVGLVLLIACANVASLLLARAARRNREISVRAALGATRWQLLRQLMSESMLLALAGGAGGLLLAAWAVRAVASQDIAGLPLGQLHIDANVLLFTLAAAIVTGLLFGLAPALASSKADLQPALKEGGRNVSGGPRQGGRRILVIAEVAMALSVLICAGLLIRSLIRLTEVQPGFRPDHLLVFDLALPKTAYPTDAEQIAFYDRVLNRLTTLPGVRSVGATSVIPFGGNWSTTSFNVEGLVIPPHQPPPWGDIRIVSPDFFHALEVPLIKGRVFNAHDDMRSPMVAVVDDEMARRCWPNSDPIGKRMTRAGDPVQNNWITVVGVVGHTKHEGLAAEPRIQVYLPYRQKAATMMAVALRTTGAPSAALPAARQAVHEIDPNVPVFSIATMTAMIDDSTGQRRFSALLLSVFSGLALLLAALGIYGVMAYAVAQRAHELGVRIALGAVRSTVVSLVLREGMMLAAWGLGLGLVAAFAATRLLASQLFVVKATDPVTFALVTLVLGFVAFLANLLPALRAMRVNPVTALRDE